jgi:hypothetical protein
MINRENTQIKALLLGHKIQYIQFNYEGESYAASPDNDPIIFSINFHIT